MKRFVATEIGYHEQPIRCCALCKHVSYSKTMCKLPKQLIWCGQIIRNVAVCPTGVCDYFKLRCADQDKEFENVEWIP